MTKLDFIKILYIKIPNVFADHYVRPPPPRTCVVILLTCTDNHIPPYVVGW